MSVQESSNEKIQEATPEEITPEKVFTRFATSPEGLSSAEVARRQKTYGKNLLREVKGRHPFLRFLSNFTSLMAILLWVGGAISLYVDMPQLGIAIWMVNVVNGVFSFWQESRASRAVAALKHMLPSYVRVVRNGGEQQVLVEDLVPGDVMLVAEGDRISADACLFDSSSLQVNQSALTGESTPVFKNHKTDPEEGAARFEVDCLIFAGTSVSSGSAKAVVVSTGMETEFGKIAVLTLSLKEMESPLQKELDRLTRQISVIALLVGLFFFLGALFFVKSPFAQTFIFALAMVVAFIPEGLLPTVTLSLALAVQRMATNNALVKRLSAVETLGATTVICSDKTGTLTQNEMTVSSLWLPDAQFTVSGFGYAPKGKVLLDGLQVHVREHAGLRELLTGAVLCNNAHVVPPDEENPNHTVLGDPTEACLRVVAQKAGLVPEEEEKQFPRLRELPFDSERKCMTTLHHLPEASGKEVYVAWVKGAPMEVLALCTDIRINGSRSAITDEQREEIGRANDRFASEGLRVLAVASRTMDEGVCQPDDEDSCTPETMERELVFIGLVAMADPPREGVEAAVALCHKASIRIIMITGDYGLTAKSIARRIGIVRGASVNVVTGVEFDEMSEDALKQALSGEVVFARMAPEQKYRVVCMLQEMGNIVAVTGDGVNDAPALRKADIGIAMGITGTDVAKDAADMILTDDNFSSIVKAVEEGRAVYNNIRKFLTYILCSNTSEAAPSAAYLLSRGGIPLPLTVMQILAVDLGTDLLPALGLGAEMPVDGIMDVPPRGRDDRLLNRQVIVKAFFWYGLLSVIFSMGAYFFVNWLHGWPHVPLASGGVIYREATTMTLGAIVFSQIGTALNCRTGQLSLFSVGFFSNRRILVGIVVEVLLLCALAYLPFLQKMFNTAPLQPLGWLYLCVIPPLVVLIDELRKALVRYRVKRVAGA